MLSLKENKTKKQLIIEALEQSESIPLEEIASKLYGGISEIEQLKVIRLLAAYRAKGDEQMKNLHVRKKRIVTIK